MNSHLPLSGMTAKWPATPWPAHLLGFHHFLLETWAAARSQCQDGLTLPF